MLNIAIVCTVLLIAMVLFVSEKVRVDLVALMIMAALMVVGALRPGFLSVEEALSGFSNEATITIAAMFILSAGLAKTGAIAEVSRHIVRIAGGSPAALFLVLMATAGTVSAFINNTAAVAVFIPVSLALGREYDISPSRLLMPLSYISIVGGTCTLIGTSTNILVSSMSAEAGLGAFGMFEMSKLGVIFFVVGLLYLRFVAGRILPDRPTEDLARKYDVGKYLTTLIVDKRSGLVMRTPAQARINEKYGVTILEIVRAGEEFWTGLRDTKLHEGDELLVLGSIHDIMQMRDGEGLSSKSQLKFADKSLTSDEVMLAEVMIAPTSTMVGRTLKGTDFRHKHGVFVLAVQKHGEAVRERIGNIKFEVGDTLLIQGRREFVEKLRDDGDFIMLQEVELPEIRADKARWALGIVAGVVALAALNVLPIVVAAVVGALWMVVTGSIKLQEAYESVDWFVIFLLAGVIPLGIAMENTGTADWIARELLSVTASWGPMAFVSVFYLLSTLFASIMSHNAAVILLVPIGIATAHELAMNPFPILMAITFAASSSMSTPFGYHTNLMVYGPGGYRFWDYIKLGVPLNIMLWLIASALIPIFWPL
jgi:di/tricarboxylate transporter